MVPDPIELGPPHSVSREEEFLKHNRVHSEANSTVFLGTKQLCRRRITAEVFDNHVGVEEHEWQLWRTKLAGFEPLGFSRLFHFFIVYWR